MATQATQTSGKVIGFVRLVVGEVKATGSDGVSRILQVGDLVIDPAAHLVTVAGMPVDLAAREFDLLHALALEAGRVVTVDDLLRRVWGAEFIGEPQVVYVHIRWLREKIEPDPNKPLRIINVRGVGYKLLPYTV